MGKILLLFIGVFFIACSDKKDIGGMVQNDQKIAYKNNFTFVLNNIKEFSLDDETINLIKYIQYIDTDTTNYLSFLNEYNNSIYFYNYESADFSHKIKCKYEEIQGYYYLNNDSIFIYSHHSGFLFCINSKLDVLNKYKMSDISKNNYEMICPYPYVSTLAPLKKYDRKIISVGFVTGETPLETSKNRPVASIFDLKNQTKNYVVNYPEMYIKYNWAGGLTYRVPYYDLCEESMIISFPANHYIVKYALSTGKQTSHYAGSANIENIKSFPYLKNKPIDEEKAWEWYMKTPSYEGIFYDKYRNRYYRIARLPVKSFNKDEMGNKKPIVIIILDVNLQYLGEVNLPVDIRFYPYNCFVSKDGFNIQVLTDNEDNLTYYQYDFLDNEKN